MRIAVIGAGAIGGWLTAGCIEAGAKATVLARGASLEALQRDGLRLDDGEKQKRYRVEATDNPGARVVGTVVHAASHVTAPGNIRLMKANKVWLGDAGSGQHSQTVAKLFAAGGIPAENTKELHWHVWNKLWGNSNVNPLSALARAVVSQLLDDDHVRSLIQAMMREMTEIGALIGLTGFDELDERIAITRKFGPIRTSMLQDLEAGRPLELDPILGGLLELARYLGHPTPTMDGVYGPARILDRNLRT